MSHLRRVDAAYADTANLDAFSRLRVSTPIGVFDSTFQYDLLPLLYYAVVANSGTVTHAPNTASASLNTAAIASSSAILQSKQYFRYIPAKSQLIVMTQVFGAAVASVVRRAGYFDANDGIFLEQNGVVDIAVVRRTSTSGAPVDNRVVKSSWNLDKLDGTGPSGFTLDLSKSSILVIDLQWLGMGRVRVGFDIDGQIIYVHEFLNANVLAVPYMKTANLPIRWQVSGDSASTMYANCASVISEGGTEFDRGYLFSRASGSVTAASGARTCLLALRPALTFNSIVNRIQAQLDSFAGLVTGNNPILLELLYNPTVTGGAWAAHDSSSSVEYNATATGISGGIAVDGMFCPASATAVGAVAGNANVNRLPFTLDTTGANPITIAICATGLGGTSASRGQLSWRELR